MNALRYGSDQAARTLARDEAREARLAPLTHRCDSECTAHNCDAFEIKCERAHEYPCELCGRPGACGDNGTCYGGCANATHLGPDELDERIARRAVAS